MNKQEILDLFMLAKELEYLRTHQKKILRMAAEKAGELEDPNCRPYQEVVLKVQKCMTPVIEMLLNFNELSCIVIDDEPELRKQCEAHRGQLMMELDAMRRADKLRATIME